MKCVYYMATKRKVDLVNLIEATCDILVDAGVLADDDSKIVVSHDGSRVKLDRDNPRAEITITEITQ
jgi:Holliday junction resolvase RusA-like endonuclease